MEGQMRCCGWLATLLLLAMSMPHAKAQDLPSQPPVSVVSSGGGLSTNLIIMIIVCAGGGIIIIGALGGLFLVCSRRRGELKGDTEAPPIVKSNHVAPDWHAAMDPYNAQNDQEYVAKIFSYKELQLATRDFSPKHLVGEGGFGRVYYAKLSDGRVAAVKRLDRAGRQGEKEFRVEVDLLSRLASPFLLSLWGYCADGEHRVLVYGFMPNGSLQEHLFTDGRPGSPQPLDWAARLQIALDAARGLEYLHEVAQPTVIHRDFKSSNVLLDFNYRAKVSDFGLAKLSPDKGEYVSTRVLGTQGYVAPEYALTGHLTTKSDVYSYGVVLLELITGRPPVDPRRKSGEIVLVPWVMPMLVDRHRLQEIVDPRLDGQYSNKDLTQLAAIAAMCVQGQADYRPLMRDVVQSLLPLVMNSVRSSSGGGSGGSAGERRKNNEELFLAHMAEAEVRKQDPQQVNSEHFESREFTSQEFQHAVEARYPGSIKGRPDSANRESAPPAGENEDHVSTGDASEGRSEPGGSPRGTDFYDALSRQPSGNGSENFSPGGREQPGEDSEAEERSKALVHDGWKSTPSGQVYVSRDYDSSDLESQYVHPGFDVGALAATDSYSRGPIYTPEGPIYSPLGPSNSREGRTYPVEQIIHNTRKPVFHPQEPINTAPEPAQERIYAAKEPVNTADRYEFERGRFSTPRRAGNRTPDRGPVNSRGRGGSYTPERLGGRGPPRRFSPGRPPRPPSGEVHEIEEFEKISVRGNGELRDHLDGVKRTPAGEVYVSRDYDSGEVRRSVERHWDKVESSREGLLPPGQSTGRG
ncbi:Protein kinase superfamily protein [Klebsormidium nitens]|uniref:Protein kinase superfamily protein n=1 Tax=Klebsormidium nitens TaxID=105231 RepID=A0A1Y1IFA0_KLENI|nr:Protein kinase superfamily protein [Klebsormidium nitens]|eukprot:GAQ86778.1 Protein kinase superfamily protein [Klebsormidium nitens]